MAHRLHGSRAEHPGYCHKHVSRRRAEEIGQGSRHEWEAGRIYVRAAGKRRAERRRISITCSYLAFRSATVPDQGARLVSLGLLGASALHLPIGAVCELTLPDRPQMQAAVAWCEAGLLGCASTEMVSAVTYDAILEHWVATGYHR